MTSPSSTELTTAVVTAAATVGEAIGDSEAPVDAEELLDGGEPYAVVYSTGFRNIDGPAEDRNADVWFEYQITTVGISRLQVEDVRDQIRAAVLAGTYTLTGRSVAGEIAVEPFPVDRDDDIQPPRFYAIDLFVFPTMPS